MTRMIALTNSDQCALVDDDLYDFLMQWRWHLHSQGYARRSQERRAIYMHHVVMGDQRDTTHEIDHIDRNKLNNQRCNLRIATHSQNLANLSTNTLKTTRSTSRYKGVLWRKDRQNWRAKIGFQGRVYYLGAFASEIEAAQAYNDKAVELFGEYAVLNEVGF